MEFWPQFSPAIAKAAAKAGKPDFFMFGEVYSADPEVESTYVRRGGLPATLDFPFQEAAKGYAAGAGSGARALADLYAKDDLYTARDTGAGPAAHLPRQPRHGPDRLVHRRPAAPTRPPTCAATSSPTS